MLLRRAARIVMFDIGWVGGHQRGQEDRHDGRDLRPADRAARLHRPGGADRRHAHLSTNAPNALVQETVRAYYTGWYGDIVTELPAVVDGRITPPTGPGLGTALRPDLLRRADAHVRVTSAADLG